MAEQYFHPYYNQWDWQSVSEVTAETAGRNFFRQRLEFGSPIDSSPALGDRPFDIEPFVAHRVRKLPDILQPDIQKIGLGISLQRSKQVDQRLQDVIQQHANAPDWEKPELFYKYSDIKDIADYNRGRLARQKANLANAEWLAFRDNQMLELAKEDPVFRKNWETVLKRYHQFEDKALSVLRDRRIIQSDDFPVEVHITKAANETMSKPEFWDAHVNASQRLTKAGLNRKGFPVAGRLLSAPGVAADVAQIATIAGVSPMKHYDQTGATYTNDEVVEVDGVKRVRSEMEELAAYHPDNAKNHPEISDRARIEFFRKRGQSEMYLAELPGYAKWKKGQEEADAEVQRRFSMMNMNR